MLRPHVRHRGNQLNYILVFLPSHVMRIIICPHVADFREERMIRGERKGMGGPFVRELFHDAQDASRRAMEVFIVVLKCVTELHPI